MVNVIGFEQNIEPHSRRGPLMEVAEMKARELLNMELAERRTLRLSHAEG